jgi:hypothetical protein
MSYLIDELELTIVPVASPPEILAQDQSVVNTGTYIPPGTTDSMPSFDPTSFWSYLSVPGPPAPQ